MTLFCFRNLMHFVLFILMVGFHSLHNLFNSSWHFCKLSSENDIITMSSACNKQLIPVPLSSVTSKSRRSPRSRRCVRSLISFSRRLKAMRLSMMGLLDRICRHPHCNFPYWYQKFLCPVEPLYFSDEKSTTVEQ